MQAETISVGLDGPDIEAIQDVKGVLASAEAGGSTTAVRPGLFAEGPPIHVVAGGFVYDAAQSLATYSGGARLWQGATEFRGRTIVIDETTGDISAEGSVRTRTTMVQNDDDLDDVVEATTEGRAETLFFDNQDRQATYTTDAVFSSALFTLGSDAIELFLHDDARTLVRIEADGEVDLELDTRSVTGGTLAYDDSEGRYDLTGDPVRVIDEMEEECRETTGRSVTFYANGQSISADGQSAERTVSSSGSCG
jgi:lipopolysaccharide export system protein LptA